MADKHGRVQELIQKNLSEIIIYQLKSKLCEGASVNDVTVTRDYSYCKVYVTHLDPEKSDALVTYLNKNAGKIRSMLAQTLDIYKVPSLAFYKDTVYENARKMDALIEKALNSKPRTLKDLDDEEKDDQ